MYRDPTGRMANALRSREMLEDSMRTQEALNNMTPQQRRAFQLRRWRNIALSIVLSVAIIIAFTMLYFVVFVRIP